MIVRWRSGSLRRLNLELEQTAELRSEELLKREAELRAARKLLEDMAHLDGLSGVANRPRLDAYLQEMWQHCNEQRIPLSVLMIDADNFQQFNDAHGHLAGDEIIRALAKALDSNITDPRQLLARFGSDEFAAVLPGFDQAQAREYAEYMRQSVFEARARTQKITISIGVGEIHPDLGENIELLLQRADEAMYQAKQDGRNCVV
jgi:diguanylate cyclase (GGDEF)-like protein